MSEVATNLRIASLNDAFRTTFIGGQVLITPGIKALPAELQEAILSEVRTFNTFTEDNDPYGEHDFGSSRCHGKLINWKIDYYDLEMTYRSEDPSNPHVTKRVLTIMLAEEY